MNLFPQHMDIWAMQRSELSSKISTLKSQDKFSTLHKIWGPWAIQGQDLMSSLWKWEVSLSSRGTHASGMSKLQYLLKDEQRSFSFAPCQGLQTQLQFVIKLRDTACF